MHDGGSIRIEVHMKRFSAPISVDSGDSTTRYHIKESIDPTGTPPSR